MYDSSKDVNRKVVGFGSCVDDPISDDREDASEDDGEFGAVSVKGPDREWSRNEKYQRAGNAQVVQLSEAYAVPFRCRGRDNSRRGITPSNGKVKQRYFGEAKVSSFVSLVRGLTDEAFSFDIGKTVVTGAVVFGVVLRRRFSR